MALDRETVRKIAFLARLKVPEEELAALTGELDNIIGWVEQLGKVDTKGIEPMTSVGKFKPYMREDAVSERRPREDILANAPDAEDGFFTVPKVIE